MRNDSIVQGDGVGVVLITEMSKVHRNQEREMWYTALSRARHHVVVFDLADGVPSK